MILRFNKIITLLFLLFALNNTCHAQFIKGFGATLGATFSTQKWLYSNPELSFKKKYKPGLNGSAFVEYIDHKYYRMITELQYNMKGAKEPNALPFFPSKYKANYISFNNFFKIRQELYTVTPYALAGPRVEFLLNSNIPQMRAVHVTASAGLGMEFLFARPWIFFAEVQYNPDAMKAYRINDLRIRQNAWEIRVGVKYEHKKKSDCPHPKGQKNF